MSTTTASIQSLSERIEQAVHEHILATHAAAAAAVERAFTTTARVQVRTPRPPPQRPGAGSRRRNPVEMAAVGERLYQAVCAKPGETMTVLAADVDVAPRVLSRPMQHLKRAGRVRSIGQRHLTRYFPLMSEAASSE